MAKKIMPKTRISKLNVTRCYFCKLGDKYEEAYNKFTAEATEKNPEKNFKAWWRVDDKTPGVPGYKITTFRVATKEDWRNDDGLTEESTTYICENCMGVINKCFTHLGEAEEISYARKETKVFPMPDLEDVEEIEEG